MQQLDATSHQGVGVFTIEPESTVLLTYRQSTPMHGRQFSCGLDPIQGLLATQAVRKRSGHHKIEVAMAAPSAVCQTS
jgi:hypothetical protein